MSTGNLEGFVGVVALLVVPWRSASTHSFKTKDMGLILQWIVF